MDRDTVHGSPDLSRRTGHPANPRALDMRRSRRASIDASDINPPVLGQDCSPTQSVSSFNFHKDSPSSSHRISLDSNATDQANVHGTVVVPQPASLPAPLPLSNRRVSTTVRPTVAQIITRTSSASGTRRQSKTTIGTDAEYPAGSLRPHREVRPWAKWQNAVLTNPHHPFWTVYDTVNRSLDFFHFLVLPIQAAFGCDLGAMFVPAYLAFDLIFCFSTYLEIRRPRTDQFGQLVIKANEKRKLHLSQLATKLEFLALIPIDWVILIAATYTNTSMICSSPFYIYENGNIQSSTPIPGLNLSGIRYLYDSTHTPWILQIYGWTRMIRLLRMYRTVQWVIDIPIPRLTDPISRLVKTLILTIMFSHLDSCMFWLMSINLPLGNRWVDRYGILSDSSGKLRSFSQRVTRSFFSAEKSIFFLQREVDVLPEIIFQFVEMMFACVIYGSIFGIMASIVRSLDSQAGLDKAAKQRNFKKGNLATYLKQYKFPPDLQTKVLQQEEFEWAHKKGVDTDDLFKALPQTLREQVNYHLYYDLIASVPIFKEHAEEVVKRALCQKISIINVTSNFYICKAGERGTEMYFLREGHVEVMPPDESRVFVTLGPGAFFGEVALFSNSLRTATIKTKTEVQLCVLKKREFDEILAQYSHLVEIFQEQIEARYAADRARAAALAEDIARVREEEESRTMLPSVMDQHGSLASLILAASDAGSNLLALRASSRLMLNEEPMVAVTSPVEPKSAFLLPQSAAAAAPMLRSGSVAVMSSGAIPSVQPRRGSSPFVTSPTPASLSLPTSALAVNVVKVVQP
ncbi:hypothetical protein BC828DRAFT_390157 [Blastocladiella britannica]|nr:hypothetical protein BC828DRAFT_390157 [Blastocladiella britannica]